MLKDYLGKTTKQIENMVKAKCAEEGVKIPKIPNYTKTTDIDGLEPTINGYGFDRFWFKTMAEAEAFRDFIKKADVYEDDYDYSIGYKYRYLKPFDTDDNRSIEHKKFYKKEDIMHFEDKLKTFKAIKEANEQLEREYNTAKQAYREIRDEIMTKHYAAAKVQALIEHMKEVLDEYIELAQSQGSNYPVEIATQYMFKAYKEFNELIRHGEGEEARLAQDLWIKVIEEAEECQK